MAAVYTAYSEPTMHCILLVVYVCDSTGVYVSIIIMSLLTSVVAVSLAMCLLFFEQHT